MADDDPHDHDEREREVTPPPIAPSSGGDAGGDAMGGGIFAAPEIQTTSGTPGGGGPGGGGGAGFERPAIQTTSGDATGGDTVGGDAAGGDAAGGDAVGGDAVGGGVAGPDGGGAIGTAAKGGEVFGVPEVQTTAAPRTFSPVKVGAIVVVVILVLAGGGFALTRSDSHKTATATEAGSCADGSDAPACESGSAASCATGSTGSCENASASACDTTSGALCTPAPQNVVLDSCFQVDNLGSSSDVIPTFLFTPIVPGQYTVNLATGAGSLTGSANTAAGASFVAVPVHFTTFTTISGITILGPRGAIDSGAFSKVLPFELNAATDKATDCDGNKLKGLTVPPADVTSTLTVFLDSLAGNFRAGDVDGAIAKLDPVVLQIHTADECRATVSTFTDPTFAFAVKSVDGPSPFDYTSGGQTKTVPTVFFVDVTETRRGQPIDLQVHVSQSTDGGLHWFTPCEPAPN